MEMSLTMVMTAWTLSGSISIPVMRVVAMDIPLVPMLVPLGPTALSDQLCSLGSLYFSTGYQRSNLT